MLAHFPKTVVMVCVFICSINWNVYCQTAKYNTLNDIAYSPNKDLYSIERCKLNLYYPEESKDFTTVIWFHGGGLNSGEKDIPGYLKNNNLAIAGIGYRLSPKAKVEDIINDAADAVKWVYDNISSKGGSKHKIVIAGHSAGAYLALMLALNPSYLSDRGIDPDQLLGIGSFSAQTITHFTARKEQNRSDLSPSVDELAPLYWVRKNTPPILLITGDRELELMGRYEENAYLWRMLTLHGNTNVQLMELDGYGHNMAYPAFPLLLKAIKSWELAK